MPLSSHSQRLIAAGDCFFTSFIAMTASKKRNGNARGDATKKYCHYETDFCPST